MCLVSEVSHYLGLNLEKKNNNSSEGKKDIAESVYKTVAPTSKL